MSSGDPICPWPKHSWKHRNDRGTGHGPVTPVGESGSPVEFCKDCSKLSNGKCWKHSVTAQPSWIPASPIKVTITSTAERIGWSCPKCGSVYAPHVEECRRCNG